MELVFPKALRVPAGKESAVVHRWPPEGSLCEAFAAEVEKKTQRKVPYKGVIYVLQGQCQKYLE